MAAKLDEVVFARDQPTLHEWMKGLLSSEDVISMMDIDLPQKFGPGYLARKLDDDCRRMKVNVELFEVLSALREQALVVVATDNMDCFVTAFEVAVQLEWRVDRFG